MKCLIKTDNNTSIVRRKFVPIRFKIERENQFINASAKLPFSTAKVVGVLTTVNGKKPCSDDPLPPRYYFGFTDTEMTDDSFLQLQEGTLYDEDYPPDIFVEQQAGGWWYFAHPVLDRLPSYQDDQFLEPLRDAKELNILFPGQCEPEQYLLYSKPFTGSIWITFEEYT